jgi:hypothetical protein
MILGILSLVCFGLLAGIPAIILGHMAKNEIDASGGMQEGRGMAQAGFIMGIISTVLSVLGAIIWIVALGAMMSTGGIETTY